MNIALFLEMAAGTAPAQVALVSEGRRWTYGELFNAAGRAAELISLSGAQHVALLDESSAASVIALFGAALAGVPFVPLNYRLADADLAGLLERTSPMLLVGDYSRAARLCADPRNALFGRDEFLHAALACNAVEVVADGDIVCVQLFTSGTTGSPKAAILRHANLVAYVLGTVEFASAEEDAVGLLTVPPYHIAGVAAVLTSIYAMRRIVLLPSFSPEGWLDLVAQERVASAFVVPTMLARIVERIDAGHPADLGSLSAISYGGGRMPTELIARALDLMPGTGFTNAYGLTETSSTIALFGPEDHRAAYGSPDPAVRKRLTSVGKPLPTIELEIRDEAGAVLGPGEAGEIFVRGEQVAGEYREAKALTADGWFPTRDAGFLDAEGYLFLSGRVDDVIVRGGENISPGEIEDVLRSHKAIADACACGIASLEWGETVAVAVVPTTDADPPDPDELRDLVRSRLRSSRVPESILFVSELPYNDMGKLLRRVVRKSFA